MKIYLGNYIVGDVMKKIADIDRYYTRAEHSVEIFSEEGIYQVLSNKLYKQNVCDDKIVRITRADGIDLIIDKSTVGIKEVHHIPRHHISIPTTQLIYQTKVHGPKLVIEGSYSGIHSNKDRYFGFLPSDFYFEVQSETEDLNGFLSLLK
jgi:hypothetical protein